MQLLVASRRAELRPSLADKPARHRNLRLQSDLSGSSHMEEETMDGIIYLVGLIVIILFILSAFGLR